jgi:shikimate dehydrogenase
MHNIDHYAVAGHPVAHSQSPFIHAMFAAQTGQSVRYGRLLCPLDEGGFASTVRDFAASRGGSMGEFDSCGSSTDAGNVSRGCNVTVPFKFEAFALGQRHSERALLAQAANLLRFDAEGWLADNTDGAGLVRDIEHNAGVTLAGSRVLLIGAGGAAAGALGALIAARPAEVVLCNRTVDKAEALAARHAAWADAHGVRLQSASLQQPGGAFDALINASASSLHSDEVPVPASALRQGTLALDMMYGAAAQPFVDWAETHGACGRDGLGMLVEQAAESFFIWRGVRPDTAPVLEALQHKLAAATKPA